MTATLPPVDVSGKSELDEVEFEGGAARRDQTFRSSRLTTTDMNSAIPMNPGVSLSQYTADNLFCVRPGAVTNAVEHCKTAVVNSQLDGVLRGSWLLTEIDHWDFEKEKLVLLATNSVLVIQYDFILLKVHDFRRIMLTSINRMEVGNVMYPANSIMQARQHGGVRIHWATTSPSFSQRWNPFCSDVGFVTLSHHLLAYKPEERQTNTFNVSDFFDAVNVAIRGHNIAVKIDSGPIIVESYASVASLVYNQSHLGFNMSRGGVSF